MAAVASDGPTSASEDGADRRAVDVGVESGGKTAQVSSGLVVRRPGLSDLDVDDLANCPTPEDALSLLSNDASEAMQRMPEPEMIEVCKTIVALADVVAKTHAPTVASIKVSIWSDGGFESVGESNGRTFYRRHDRSVVAAFSGAICATARAHASRETGLAHAHALDSWGQALVEAGAYVAEIASAARSIAGEEIEKRVSKTSARV